MKRNGLISRILALFLLLLLLQKVTVNLYLHNDLHVAGNTGKQVPAEQKVITVNCSCIDDFLTPFDAAATVVPEIISPCFGTAINPVISSFLYGEKETESLRGPPVCLSV